MALQSSKVERELIWQTIVWKCIIGGDKMGLCVKIKDMFHAWGKCCWRNPNSHLGLFYMTYCQRCPYKGINLYFALAFDDANHNVRSHSLLSNHTTDWWKQWNNSMCFSILLVCHGKECLEDKNRLLSVSEMFSSDGSVKKTDGKNCMLQGALTEFLQGDNVSSGKTDETAPIPECNRKKMVEIRKAKLRKPKGSNWKT